MRPSVGLSQSSIIAASMIVAFFVFVTVRGELPYYLGVLTGKGQGVTSGPGGSRAGFTSGPGIGIGIGPGGISVGSGGISVSVGFPGGGGGPVYGGGRQDPCQLYPEICDPLSLGAGGIGSGGAGIPGFIPDPFGSLLG